MSDVKCPNPAEHYELAQAQARIRELEAEVADAEKPWKQRVMDLERDLAHERELRKQLLQQHERLQGDLADDRQSFCTPEERRVLDACNAFKAEDFEEHDSLKYLVGGEKQHTLIEAIEAMNLAADDYGLASNPMTARRAAKGGATDDNGFLRETIAALRAQKGGG